MNASDINEFNAYRFSDSYTIETVDEPINVFGCEHNRSEAEAIARWIEGNNGTRVRVIYNGPDKVRAAQQFRSVPFRFKFRADALRDMSPLR